MRRNDELRVLFNEIVDSDEGGKLTRGRECCFGLVKQVKAIASKTINEDSEQRFSVRLLMQAAVAIS